MSQDSSFLIPDNVNVSVAQHVLTIYPAVLKAFYQTKVKGGGEKLSQAYNDDSWRYEEFPNELQKRKTGKAGLNKDELERLVRWKITHQTNRPFLLPQIRKNNPDDVELCTAAARVLLSESTSMTDQHQSPSVDQVRKALDKVCELKGVGPATGTLILSVFNATNVPFFEDELYSWLIPEFSGKLKYSVKEYFELFDRFRASLTSDLSKGYQSMKTAQAFEKVAFVHEHWDCVEDEEKKILQQLSMNHDQRKEHSDSRQDDKKETQEIDVQENPRKVKAITKKSALAKHTNKRATTEEQEQPLSTRRSKRVKT